MPPPPTPAPWRAEFLDHLAQLKLPTFTLATLHPVPESEAPAAGLPALPRARTCVLRGLWGEDLPGSSSGGGHGNDNSNNPAPRNPPLYESDLPVFTTDARAAKAGELFDSAAGAGGGGMGPGSTTGGGGPVEAVFWIEPAQTQWRLRGSGWVLAAEDADSGSGGARRARAALMARMRRRKAQDGEEGKAGDEDEGAGAEWSFAREVTAHFGNLSPLMRGSFKGPPPGVPVAYGAGEGEVLGQRLNDVEDEAALRNFRVVVIVPHEVDQIDLSDEVRHRRWLYVYRGPGGKPKEAGGEMFGDWERIEMWP